MKIALLSFIYNTNYGGALQVFALEKAIEKRYPGIKCEYLDYRKNSLWIDMKWGFRRMCSCLRESDGTTETSLKKLFAAGIETLRSKMRPPQSDNSKAQYEQFWKLSHYSRPLTKRQMMAAAEKYDMFIVGSDQVWNPKLNHLDTTYLLDFVQEKHLKYCYAPSFGMAELPGLCVKQYTRYLLEFNMLSCREKTGGELIERLTGKHARHVLDPVFLVSRDEWLAVSKTKAQEKDYVLVYMLGDSPKLLDAAKEYAQKKKWKLKLISNGGSETNGATGPAEWLGYFANCAYVFTNSFHGTAFSIIFNKEFRTEITDNEYFANVSSRMRDLLELFQLEERLLTTDFYDDKIDYESVNRLLESEIQKSYAYLDEMMERVKGKMG